MVVNTIYTLYTYIYIWKKFPGENNEKNVPQKMLCSRITMNTTIVETKLLKNF